MILDQTSHKKDLSIDWLASRFRFDMSSRDKKLNSQFIQSLPKDRPLKMADLGTGTGANFVYLSEQIPGAQHWLLIDNEPQFTSELPSCLARLAKELPKASREKWQERIQRQEITFEVCFFDFLEAREFFAEHRLDAITANAVFDGISHAQFIALIDDIRQTQSPGLQLYFTINLNHKLSFQPKTANDEKVRAFFHGHMQRLQSFGRAMGPSSGEEVMTLLEKAGFQAWSADSTWHIETDAKDFLLENLEFIKGALLDTWPQSKELRHWQEQRSAEVLRQELAMAVGHNDVLALFK